jgi:hypothetical protein
MRVVERRERSELAGWPFEIGLQGHKTVALVQIDENEGWHECQKWTLLAPEAQMAAYQYVGYILGGTTLGRTTVGAEGRLGASDCVVDNPLRARRPGDHRRKLSK